MRKKTPPTTSLPQAMRRRALWHLVRSGGCSVALVLPDSNAVFVRPVQPCMLCCISFASQHCYIRASCASRRAARGELRERWSAESAVGALTRLLTLFLRKMNDALCLMGPCIRPVRFTTDTESLQVQRETKRQEFLREKKHQEFFLATQDPIPNFCFTLVKRS